MLFNSVEFLFLFLPATLIAFAAARRYGERASLALLLLASLIFYSAWNWRYTPWLLASVVTNFALAKVLEKHKSPAILWSAIALNLAPLIWAKYAPWLGAMAGLNIQATELPLGISFVTFLQIAFVVDVWAGRTKAVRPLPYCVFVTWFPHLISGPILRYAEISPQLARVNESHPRRDEQIARALLLILTGLFSKVVIADTVAVYVDPLFARAQVLVWWEAWTAAIGYSVQLYFDFAGFCSVALGVSLLFGIRLPINFNSPYRATSVTDFWRRWHISLSTWFRDYVYVPMGGNRRGRAREFVALVTTFFLAGLWHGAAWTFVIWGLLHAAMIVVHRTWTRARMSMPDAAGQLLTVLGVVLAWVPFRAANMSDALRIWEAMAGLHGFAAPAGIAALGDYLPGFIRFVPVPGLSGSELIILLAVLCAAATLPNVNDWKLSPTPRWATALAGVALLVAFSLSRPTQYLYWQW